MVTIKKKQYAYRLDPELVERAKEKMDSNPLFPAGSGTRINFLLKMVALGKLKLEVR